MTFMAYLTRRTKQFTSDTKTANQRKRQPQSSNTRQKKDVGDYWLGKTIGRGASGRVKLGIHKHTGEKVAIKMIARSYLVSSITTAKSVQRELAILQLLHHPHLVELKQVLQDSYYVYFVMEYLEGGELFHILAERGKFKESDARRLFYQMVSSLAWCHAHHICHRDLKPENILLTKSKKHIKIADFGMAAMNTNLKTSCGSPHYASPEIIKGKAYDGTRTDIWSLGVILFALLSGHLPFDDENMSRLLGKIKTGHYRPLPNSLSMEAKHLVKKMLVVDARRRITMNEILHHPWLTSTSSNHSPIGDPLKILPLGAPMINHTLILEGRIWETLKVLWRDLRQEDIIHALATQGSNVQKLTCLLLQQRLNRIDQEEGKSLYQETSSTTSVCRTYSENDADIHSSSPQNNNKNNNNNNNNNKIMHNRNGSDDVGSKCSMATPYDSPISNVSFARTIDMPPTPKNTTYDKDLTMEYNFPSKRKSGNKCDHAPLSWNGDPYIGSPQQQENVPSVTTPITRSRWIYREQQLTLIPTSDQYCGGNPNSQPTQQQQQRRTINASDSQHQRRFSANSPLLVSYSNNVCLTSLHVEGDIQLQSATSTEKLSTMTSKKPLSTTYNCIEQRQYQHRIETTNHQKSASHSLSSVFSSLWPSSTSNTTAATSISPPSTSSPLISTSLSIGSHWWSKTLDHLLHPWIERQPKPVTFDWHGKHECQLAGKIHQVLREQFNGKLNGRAYPNQQIVWNGSLKVDLPLRGFDTKESGSKSRIWFVCHMVHQHERHFKISLVYLKGDVTLWSKGTQNLVATLTHYEHDANKLMLANGW
ncbi:kinase-like domain-containing protein [Absidia repens]|uniref:Kinase-like domain-containing protein n=1 Tax=Absidia repens TaxID=90262 RepID=A0A1X2HXY2_9FUNG|nr:kinase-like domain-containing protein [Absidia repens]